MNTPTIFSAMPLRPTRPFVGITICPPNAESAAAYYLHSFRDVLGPKRSSRVADRPADLAGDRRDDARSWRPAAAADRMEPAAHTDCDLTVLDEATGVLFAGDLVFLQHVPVLDGSLTGWLSVLPRLAEVPARIVVPGHGRLAAWPQALDDERRYLTTLADDTRRISRPVCRWRRPVPQIGASERDRWALFDDYNPRNATAAFSELEWE